MPVRPQRLHQQPRAAGLRRSPCLEEHELPPRRRVRIEPAQARARAVPVGGVLPVRTARQVVCGSRQCLQRRRDARHANRSREQSLRLRAAQRVRLAAGGGAQRDGEARQLRRGRIAEAHLQLVAPPVTILQVLLAAEAAQLPIDHDADPCA